MTSKYVTGVLLCYDRYSRSCELCMEYMVCRMALDTLAQLEALNIKGEHRYCGGSAWKKGSDGSKKYAGLSTSGRVFAGCNHMIVMAAVNMLGTGEKYAYIYLMFKRYFVARGVHTVFGDVMCKWYPWLESVSAHKLSRFVFVRFLCPRLHLLVDEIQHPCQSHASELCGLSSLTCSSLLSRGLVLVLPAEVSAN
jgi:Kyakuja-Dileera-Zisupton transposase